MPAAGLRDVRAARRLRDGQLITTRQDGPIVRFVDGDAVLDRATFARLLAVEDGGLRDALTAAIEAAPSAAIAWELAPFAKATDGLPAEMALVDSPALARARPDPAPFEAHFRPREPFARFWNLGRDALLVAPHPGAFRDGAHLAAFVRGDGDPDGLFREVGAALAEARRAFEPVWVSTAGLGVSWLHVRLDRRPKYYRYGPFTAA